MRHDDCEVTGDAKDAWTALSVCLLVMLKMLGKNPGPSPRARISRRSGRKRSTQQLLPREKNHTAIEKQRKAEEGSESNCTKLTSDSRCISFCSLNSLAECASTLETLNFIESETYESFDMLAVHMLQLVCLKKHWTCLMGMPRCHFGVSIFSVTYAGHVCWPLRRKRILGLSCSHSFHVALGHGHEFLPTAEKRAIHPIEIRHFSNRRSKVIPTKMVFLLVSL